MDSQAAIAPRASRLDAAKLRGLAIDAVGYFGVSVVALAVDWGGLTLLHRGLGWRYLVASSVSFLLGLVVAWSLAAISVFRGRRKLSRTAELLGFLLTGVTGLAITQGAMALLVGGLGIPAELAKLPIAGLVFAFNFTSRRALLFAPAPAGISTARPERNVDWLAGLAAFGAMLAIFLLTHSASGIVGDAKIYMGRALADLDPAGVGRDLMFVLDGQSAFSIFRLLARALVAQLSPLHAALVLTAASQALWFAGLVCIARALAGSRAMSRTLWIVALACLLPTRYGLPGLLSFAEPLAEPRPFAEAFTLLAVAGWLRGHRALALVCMAGAALFHPIMSLAGLACIWLIGAREHYALRVLAAGTATLVAIGAFEQWPLADRLFTTADAEWLALLRARSGYLFPDLWSVDAFALIGVQVVTLLVGLQKADRRWRAVVLASLVAGLAGVAIAWFVGVVWPSILLLQLQMWRMWWLPACLSTVTFGALALRARDGDGHERIVFGLLTLAFALHGIAGIAVACAVSALAFDRYGRERWPTLQPRVPLIVWGAIVVFVTSIWSSTLPTNAKLFALWQPDFTPRVLQIAIVAARELLIVAGAAFATFGAGRLAHASIAVRVTASGLLLAGAVALWNQTATVDGVLGRGVRQADLAALTGPAHRDVLWLKGVMEPWLWLGAPNWSAKIQGAGIVFSRRLAADYAARARFLIDNGFEDQDYLNRLQTGQTYPMPTTAAFHALCSRVDAPSAVVLPLAPGATPPSAWGSAVWTAPAPLLEPPSDADGHVFRVDRYAVVRCADHR